MLDVHPPHSAVHGWRDFLIHLVTITVGLFIALMLEAAVEGMHHREIVKTARENIRREIEQNAAEAKKDIAYVQTDADAMKANLVKARALRDDRHALEHNELRFSFQWSGFGDSAWRSARDMGALSYMPASEVQAYADNYVQQDLVQAEAVTLFTKQSELAAPVMMETDPVNMRPEEVQELMHGTAMIYVHLESLKQLTEQLEKNYEDTLRK
jgi:hypothetical protein